MKREKISERLSESQVVELVKIYKEHACLWDVSNPNYRNRVVRDRAYKEILEKLKIPGLKVAHIPQKIKNLRSSYYTELRKVEKSTRGGRTYTPKVAWFSIADEMLRNRNQVLWSQNLETPETESEAESSDGRAIKNDPESTTNIVDQNTKNATVSQTTSTSSQISEPPTKYEDDEFDVYGKYIAISLRSMPQEMSIIARMELQKTMANMQLMALKKEKRGINLEQYGPSTSKMEDDLLEDPPDDLVGMEEDPYLTSIKIEEDD